jgi:predicted small secreted protein
MGRAVAASLLAGMAFASGCGGNPEQGAEDIARGARAIEDAVSAAKPRPNLKLPAVAGAERVITEEQAEAAAKREVCAALDAYTSDPSKSVSEYIRDYANNQRALADWHLNEIDPDEADRLADAASGINDTQEASEVASKLSCD